MTDQHSTPVPTDREPAERLDLTGLKCPLPVLRTNKALRALGPGAVIEVTADDPATAKDFPAYCATAGHDLLAAEEAGAGRFVFRIRKAG
ncbi:MAG: sulfurtransferase TusA family protein [Alphaproteobacteria bacterium]